MKDEKPIPLDLRGLKCPMPALRLGKTLSTARKGARYLVSVTDPMAVIDIPHLLQGTGDRLLEEIRGETEIGFLVEKT